MKVDIVDARFCTEMEVFVKRNSKGETSASCSNLEARAIRE